MELKLPNGEVLKIDETINTTVPYNKEEATFKRPGKGKSVITKECLEMYCNKNLTFKEIGLMFGVTKQRIQQKVKEYGIYHKKINRFKRMTEGDKDD